LKFVARREDDETPVEVERHGSGYRVRIGERWINADFVSAGPHLRSLRLDDGRQFPLVHHREGTRHEVTIAGTTLHVEIVDPLALRRRGGDDHLGASGVIKAPMPGRITRVLIEKGASVKRGAGLLVLEAMKMENEIQAPADGIVEEIFVSAGATVESGADLVHLLPPQ
jgi:biotin carboxyl carrier protein